MTIEHPLEDEVTHLAKRVEKARGRLAYQFDPALTEALSEDELQAERELAERIRDQDRDQRWKSTQAHAATADRARQTTEAIEKADMRDLLLARRAIAAQRRESSPHAKLASLYRHRSWSLRALAGVVGAGMLWSAVNVQHNIAPGGPSDPLYWFSYLLEAMISVCLIVIMIGTNKVAEWGVLDNRKQVAAAEFALLALTVTLNTYPYVRDSQWFDAAVHAVAPVMIGVALLIHDAASSRYGFAITRASDHVRELPDPAEQIRRNLSTVAFRVDRPAALTAAQPDPNAPQPQPTLQLAAGPAGTDDNTPQTVEIELDALQAALAAEEKSAKAAATTAALAPRTEERPAPVNGSVVNGSALSAAINSSGVHGPAKKPAAPRAKAAEKNGATTKAVAALGPAKPKQVAKHDPEPITAPQPAVSAAPKRSAATEKNSPAGRNGKEAPAKETTKNGDADAESGLRNIYDTGQFRVADILEQELAELQAERRRARANRQR
ncbi:hypothetical protein D5S18_17585 [Nocardia panacis]|uniref:DUF2637 domain-containing protein n=1 Tax=Nocardia panacis TaxID=2340916 RepID=A0A3A4KAV6_9NOCA|nr:hypothetical protein [Nocardia panacis]RJO75175.1 hypothetical protein D5S18_17585 [Nocardia panacis]